MCFSAFLHSIPRGYTAQKNKSLYDVQRTNLSFADYYILSRSWSWGCLASGEFLNFHVRSWVSEGCGFKWKSALLEPRSLFFCCYCCCQEKCILMNLQGLYERSPRSASTLSKVTQCKWSALIPLSYLTTAAALLSLCYMLSHCCSNNCPSITFIGMEFLF